MDRVTRSIISIIMFLLSLCSITYTYAQESDDTEVSHKRDGTPYTDDDIVENILIKKNGKYYKKKLSYVTPMDFGAKGDGKSDDSKGKNQSSSRKNNRKLHFCTFFKIRRLPYGFA